MKGTAAGLRKDSGVELAKVLLQWSNFIRTIRECPYAHDRQAQPLCQVQGTSHLYAAAVSVANASQMPARCATGQEVWRLVL